MFTHISDIVGGAVDVGSFTTQVFLPNMRCQHALSPFAWQGRKTAAHSCGMDCFAQLKDCQARTKQKSTISRATVNDRAVGRI